MSQRQIDDILDKARRLNKELEIPSLVVQNKLKYIKEAAISKPSLFLCGGCTSNKSEVSSSFKRAFDNFNEKEKALFYLKNVTIIHSVLDNQNPSIENIYEQETKTSIFFFNQSEKQWETRHISINMMTKIMTFTSTKEEIDLHFYILRLSKKKDKQSWALQSVQSLHQPQIMRISYYKQTPQQFSNFWNRVIDEAIKDNYIKAFKGNQKTVVRNDNNMLSNKINQKLNKQTLQLKSNIDVTSIPQFPSINAQFTKKTVQIPFSGLIQQDTVDEKSKFYDGSTEYDKFKKQLMNTLTNNSNLQQFRKNVLIDLKQNRIRKLYEFNHQDYNLPLEWFSDNLMTCLSFRRWKKSLISAKLISTGKNSTIKIFLQKHEFNNKMQGTYIYKRQKIDNVDDILYIIDSPAEEQEHGQIASGRIQYCIWKFQRFASRLSIVIQAKIIHDNVKSGYPSLQLSDEFLGEMDYICYNFNMTLLNETDMNINTILFEEQYLQQIDKFDDVDELDDFYTIKNDPERFDILGSISSIKSIASFIDKIKEVFTMDEALKLPDSKNRLKFQHPNKAYDKGEPKLMLPSVKGENPYWQGEWRFTNDGEMININEKKIKDQSSVLKSIAKTLTKNLFSGKSILNLSLPVVVFSEESNLSLLCKSFAYAPLLLERAAQQIDPVHRFKQVVAFGISYNVAYIKMDKPFNPILGETFQGIIDGCLVYGEQISHHPPISATFLKGRGYTLYGNFQAKVNLGINTATGSNEGFMYISFDENNINKKLVKFNFPPGQLSGLTFGSRKLAAIQKSFYLDVQNMLFLQLNFGKHKGVTEYCKFVDGIQGKIVQLQLNTDISRLDKINKKSIIKKYGTISGRWTKEIYYDDQMIFDSWISYPFVCEQYPCPLESNAYYRKDLKLKRQNDVDAAQTAKQELQQIQRNDRKLRKKYTGKEH